MSEYGGQCQTMSERILVFVQLRKIVICPIVFGAYTMNYSTDHSRRIWVQERSIRNSKGITEPTNDRK